MFTADSLAELAARYPNLTADEIRNTARRVSEKHRSDPLHNPLAYLDRALRSMSERAPKLRPHPEGPNVPLSRGSFAPDGSWDERFSDASDTESALREFVATIVRLKISPADAVAVLQNLPLVAACYRAGVWWENGSPDETQFGGPIRVMLMLDGKPQPCPGSHSPIDWLIAAWTCVHTSTSAEEFVKQSVLRGFFPTSA